MDSEDNATMFSRYYKQQIKKRSYFNTNWRFILCLTTVYVLAVTLTFHVYAASIQTLVELEGYSHKPIFSAAEDHLEVNRDAQDYLSFDLDLNAEIKKINAENQISGVKHTRYPYIHTTETPSGYRNSAYNVDHEKKYPKLEKHLTDAAKSYTDTTSNLNPGGHNQIIGNQQTTNSAGEDIVIDGVNVRTKHTTIDMLKDIYKDIVTKQALDNGNLNNNILRTNINITKNQDSQNHTENELKVKKFDKNIQRTQDEIEGMNGTDNSQLEDEMERTNKAKDKISPNQNGLDTSVKISSITSVKEGASAVIQSKINESMADVDENQGTNGIQMASSYNATAGNEVVFSDNNQIKAMNTEENTETGTAASYTADEHRESSSNLTVDQSTREQSTAHIQKKTVFKRSISNETSEIEFIQNLSTKGTDTVDGHEGLGDGSRNSSAAIVFNKYSELHCKGYKIRTSDSRLRYVALASFPGSGNTWVRHLLHHATGIATGSVYTDGILYSAGFIGEFDCIDKPTACIVQKTHELPLIDGIKYEKAVLLIRNPYDAILSYFKFNKVGHKMDFYVAMDRMIGNELTSEWTEFVNTFGKSWLRFNYEWINNFNGEEYLIVYENLKSDTVGEIGRLCSFFNRTIEATDKICIENHKEGGFRRRHINNDDAHSLYTVDMKKEINSYIQNITSIIYKRFPDINLPWSSSDM